MSYDKFSIPASNRSFRYGDALFETIAYRENRACLLGLHLKRLQKGADILGMLLPDIFLRSDILETAIEELLHSSGIRKEARVRLQVWRKDGGLYTPQNDTVDFLLEAGPLNPYRAAKSKVTFSEEVRLAEGPCSSLKTSNALPYIIAGRERAIKEMDDLILLDNYGHVSECCAANLFWRYDDCFFTPSLDTGCIAGVMREHILQQLVASGLSIKEVKASPEELLKAHQVFSTNTLGIQPITHIDGYNFEDHLGLIQQWGP